MTTNEAGEKEVKAAGKPAPRWLDSAVTFKKSTALKISFILLGLGDLLLTVAAMYLGIWEMNPLVRFLVHIPILLVLIKVVIPVAVAWIMPGRLLIPSIALLGAAVVWNIKEICAALF
jgi:hypothetical protein